MNIQATWTGRKAYRTHVKGLRLYDQKKYDEAQRLFDDALAGYQAALKLGSEERRILMAYGVLLLKQGRFQEARGVMLKTEKIKGMTPDDLNQLRLNYAICLWKLKELDRAIEQMKMVAQGGIHSTIYGSLGYMLIEKAMETGDFAEAEAFNREAYEYDEDDAVVLDNMGQLSLAQGDREAARRYFERAIERKPEQVDTLYFLARMAQEDGDLDAAKGYIARALQGHYSALCTTGRDDAVKLGRLLGVSDTRDADE